MYGNILQILLPYKTWRYCNKFDSPKSLGVCYWCVKILQCGYMDHGLKHISFYVQKRVIAMGMCYDPALVRDKPLGALGSVKRVYYVLKSLQIIWMSEYPKVRYAGVLSSNRLLWLYLLVWYPYLRYWHFVRGIHRSPVNSPHKGQWRGALMFSLICAWTNGWENNWDAGDLRRHRARCDVTIMIPDIRRQGYAITMVADVMSK